MLMIVYYLMYQHFQDCHKILISGCGGGYDVFCGLDLLFNLHYQGKSIVLGSYSFTETKLLIQYGEKITKYCYKITHNTMFDEDGHIAKIIKETKIPPKFILEQMKCTKDEYLLSQINKNCNQPKVYFPEYKLTRYLFDQYHLDVPIYCFIDETIAPLIDSYNEIIKQEQIDGIVLVDGGTDSLMTGIEKGALGTPYEDICSIIAVSNTTVNKQFLYCLGYNVDRFHGVTDENFLKNTATLIKTGHFIGSYMLNKNDTSTQKYIDVFMHCDPENSIVNTAVIESLNGKYGDVCPEWIKHRLIKTGPLNVTPFMSLYWIYDLHGIYQQLKYDVNKMKNTTEEYEIMQMFE